MTAHQTSVEIAVKAETAPALFGAKCSCGWESESLWSDPEAAETDAANHEREPDRG